MNLENSVTANDCSSVTSSQSTLQKYQILPLLSSCGGQIVLTENISGSCMHVDEEEEDAPCWNILKPFSLLLLTQQRCLWPFENNICSGFRQNDP